MGLCPLSVCCGCYEAEQQGKSGQSGILRPKVGQGRAFQIDGAHDFDEVARRKGVGDALRPPWHGGYGGEQSAHQLEHDDEGEHHEDAL